VKARPSSRAYAKEAARLLDRVEEAARLFRDEPTAQHTHYLRTSVRRARACIALAPKAHRKARRTEHWLGRARELFSATSRIRDAHVMHDTLVRLGLEDRAATIAPPPEAMERARDLAVELLDTKRPRLRPSELSGEKLRARCSTVATELSATLRTLLPIVIADASRLEALHEARIAAKRLRYTYEVAGDAPEDRRVAWTSALQDLLGDLHDRDVLIGVLSAGERRKDLDVILESERAIRSARHEELVTWVRRTPALLDTIAPFA
jgi:CHAD domain-containing protein